MHAVIAHCMFTLHVRLMLGLAALILASASCDLPVFQSDGSVRLSGRYLRTSLFLIAVSIALAANYCRSNDG